MTPNKVFLGGVMKGPDWRKEIIPKLECPFFNPVVKDWDEKARVTEDLEKKNCGISFYMIDTHFLSGHCTIAETVEDCITRRPGRTVVCFLESSKDQDKVKSFKAVKELVSKYIGTSLVESLEDAAAEINRIAAEPVKDVYLHKNPWLSLKKMYGPTGEYVFSHEERCNGKIVAVLPYKDAEEGQVYLARSEFTPPWSTKVNFMSSITGGVDTGENPTEAARRELEEETGYSVPVESLLPLGTCHGVKSSDTVYYLYAVNVSSLPGDGNPSSYQDANESRARNVWVNGSLPKADDPLLFTLYHRWMNNPVNGVGFLENFKW